MHKPGYFLLEALCYVALSTIILFFLLQSVVATTLVLKKIATNTTALCQVCAAHNLLEKDLQAASSAVNDWKLITTDALIWHEGDWDRGWLFDTNNLYRLHGTYSKTEQTWTKKVKHLVARGIERVHFTVQTKKENVQSVRYSIAARASDYKIEQIVMLQNRVV